MSGATLASTPWAEPPRAAQPNDGDAPPQLFPAPGAPSAPAALSAAAPGAGGAALAAAPGASDVDAAARLSNLIALGSTHAETQIGAQAAGPACTAVVAPGIVSSADLVPGFAEKWGLQAAPAAESAEAFGGRWGLDAGAVDWLRRQDPRVQATLINEFSPRCEPLDVTRMFFAFANSVAKAVASSPPMPAAGCRGGPTTCGAACVAACGCGAQVLPPPAPVLLAAAGPGVRPPALAAGAVSRKTLEFIAYWNLDEGAQGLLLSLPEPTREKVVDEFDPRGSMTNVNRKFMGFARATADKLGVLQPPPSPLAVAPAPAAAPAVAPASAAALALRGDILDEFATHWGLSAEAKDYMRSLEPMARAEVITRFDPTGVIQDINRKLIGFARSIANGPRLRAEGSLPSGIPCALTGIQPALWPELPTPSPLLNAGCGGARAPPGGLGLSAEEESFLMRWGLAGAAGAGEILVRLPAPARARVVREFAPHQGTRDVFRLFAGFANSVARQAHQHQTAPAPQPLPSAAGCAAPARSPSPAAPIYGSVATPEAFADAWQLDEGSKALLRGLSAAVQLRVMAEFNPRGQINDISGKFCSFARSVASAMATEERTRGVKRSFEVPLAAPQPPLPPAPPPPPAAGPAPAL